MGCSLFANYHYQMGVTVMGFTEDFEPSVSSKEYLDSPGDKTPIVFCRSKSSRDGKKLYII